MLSLFIRLNLVTVEPTDYDSEKGTYLSAKLERMDNDYRFNVAHIRGLERHPQGYTTVFIGDDFGRYVSETPDEIIAIIEAERNRMMA